MPPKAGSMILFKFPSSTHMCNKHQQKAIAGYKIEGERLFFPNHGAQ